MLLASGHDLDLAALFAALGLVGVAWLLILRGNGKGLTMETQHWIMLFVILAVGYVVGRMWAGPANLVGLP